MMSPENKEKFSLKIGNMMLETTKVFPVVLSLVVIIVAVLGFYLIQSGKISTIEIQDLKLVRPPESYFEPTIQELSKRLKILEDNMAALSKAIENASKEKIESIGLDKIRGTIQNISSEFESLKKIIIEDPEKALAIPLLRKEMDELERKQLALAASTKDQIDRIYDFSKWFLGLMITLAIGLVTMGFVRRPKGGS